MQEQFADQENILCPGHSPTLLSFLCKRYLN